MVIFAFLMTRFIQTHGKIKDLAFLEEMHNRLYQKLQIANKIANKIAIVKITGSNLKSVCLQM